MLRLCVLCRVTRQRAGSPLFLCNAVEEPPLECFCVDFFDILFKKELPKAIEVARPIWLRGREINPSIYMNGISMSVLD